MQSQPEHAATIQSALAADLGRSMSAADAQSQRNAAIAAAYVQQQAKPAPVNCTSTKFGNTVNTSCY
jgi:hypothetical protein